MQLYSLIAVGRLHSLCTKSFPKVQTTRNIQTNNKIMVKKTNLERLHVTLYSVYKTIQRRDYTAFF